MDGFPDIGGPLLWILAGLLIAFAGRVLWKVVWFIIGAIIGATIVLVIYQILALIGYEPTPVCLLIAILIAVVAGGMLAIGYIRFWICVSAGAAGFYASMTATGNFIVAAVVGIVMFIIVYVKFNEILSVMTAIMGGLLVGAGVAAFFGGNPIVLFAVAIPIMIAGSYIQLKIEKKQKEEGKGRIEDEV